ncbi:MAG: FGGY-family carbohydrate kinase [Niabella sp.]
MSEAYFVGIDIGTQGARVVLLDKRGTPIASEEEAFLLNGLSRVVQSPTLWWACCNRLLSVLFESLADDIDLSAVKSIAVTSTSGTVIPVNKQYEPLYGAIMYSDPGAADEAALCRQAAQEAGVEGYTGFNTSCGLPKMLWFQKQFPEYTKEVYKFIHAADFITGRLCGKYEVTDYTNALKSGYNLHTNQWPAYITGHLGIPAQWLQQVIPSGKPLEVLDRRLSRKWGLSDTVIITTGITDGCASQIASGAVSPGQWNTTIGTTMVIKGVTNDEIRDGLGRIYNHRHPDGYWMPGGAGNIGADWVSRDFSERLSELNLLAEATVPSGAISYPLVQQGERFPFIAPDATGFEAEGLSLIELFVSKMEGVAYVEKYAFELMEHLSGEQVNTVFTAGGASNSDIWLRIRANVLNKKICKMKNVSGAVGAAVLAASGAYYSSLATAAAAMCRVEKIVEPQPALVRKYDQYYKRFILMLQEKKYLGENIYA